MSWHDVVQRPMKKRFNSIPVALLLAAGLQFAAYAGSLHKIWEVDLGAEIKGPAGREQMQPGVLALRFSPDGTKIAVAGNAYQYNPPMSRLIMMQVAKPKEGIQRFDIADIASDSEVLGIRPPAVAMVTIRRPYPRSIQLDQCPRRKDLRNTGRRRAGVRRCPPHSGADAI